MASRSHVCTLCASASDFRGWQCSDCHCQCQRSRLRRSVRSRLRCAQVPANAGSTAVVFVIAARQASLVLVRSDHACTRGSLTVSSTARYCVALHCARRIRSVCTIRTVARLVNAPQLRDRVQLVACAGLTGATLTRVWAWDTLGQARKWRAMQRK